MSGLHTDTAASSFPAVPQADCASARVCGHLAPGGGSTPRRSFPRAKASTVAAIEGLRRCYAQGMTKRAAAEALGIGLKLAHRIAQDYGVRPKPEAVATVNGRRANEAFKNRLPVILARLKAGDPAGQIASDMGISHKTVRHHAQQHGIPIPSGKRERFTREQDTQMQELRKRGLLMREIGAVMGISGSAVADRLRYLAKPRIETPPAAAPTHRTGIVIEHADKSRQAHRRCLCGCGVMFLSVFPGERIRPECRETWSNRG